MDISGFLCVFVVLVIPCAIWVGFDASKRPGLSWDWAIGVLFFGIIVLPIYVFQRRKYPVAVDSVLPPAGWYQDPDNPQLQRWWDGNGWNEHRRQAPALHAPAQPAGSPQEPHGTA